MLLEHVYVKSLMICKRHTVSGIHVPLLPHMLSIHARVLQDYADRVRQCYLQIEFVAASCH